MILSTYQKFTGFLTTFRFTFGQVKTFRWGDLGPRSVYDLYIIRNKLLFVTWHKPRFLYFVLMYRTPCSWNLINRSRGLLLHVTLTYMIKNQIKTTMKTEQTTLKFLLCSQTLSHVWVGVIPGTRLTGPGVFLEPTCLSYIINFTSY